MKITYVNISHLQTSNFNQSSPEVINQVEDKHSGNTENCKFTQTNLTMYELTDMFVELNKCKEENHALKKTIISCKSLENDDVKTKYYTGLHTYQVFAIVLTIVEPFIKVTLNTALPGKEQVLLTLMKLRLNLDYKDLAYRFGISQTTTATYFKNVLHILCLRSKNFVFWPEREILLKTMPQCFKEVFHDKTSVIIDCFEIKAQVPNDMLAAAQT